MGVLLAPLSDCADFIRQALAEKIDLRRPLTAPATGQQHRWPQRRQAQELAHRAFQARQRHESLLAAGGHRRCAHALLCAAGYNIR